MHIGTMLICLTPYLVPILTTPLSTVPASSLSLPTTNITLPLASPEVRNAQRRVPHHNAFLNITYHPSSSLPFPLWHEVLAAAHFQTVTLHGDREVVEEPYSYHERDCYFCAQSMPGATEKRLTYGILEESIRVLVRFLAGAGYALSVTILEGGTERGVPIGVMVIDDAGPRDLAGVRGIGGKISQR